MNKALIKLEIQWMSIILKQVFKADRPRKNRRGRLARIMAILMMIIPDRFHS